MPQSICHWVVLLSPHFSGWIRGHLDNITSTQANLDIEKVRGYDNNRQPLGRRNAGRDTFPALSYLILTTFVKNGGFCHYLQRLSEAEQLA